MTDLDQRPPWPPPAPEQAAGAEGAVEAPPEAPAGMPKGGWLRLALIGVAFLALGILGSWWMVAVVVAFLVMIFLHELGHYTAAKRAGMKVTQFFLGFGPRLWYFRRGETEYGLKAIPAGAYVRIIGMSNLEEVDPADEPRTYRAKNYWSRFCVAVAGSAMHFAIALVLLVVLLVGFGVQKTDTWRISEVSGLANGSCPSCVAGLQPGDRIVGIDGQGVTEYADLVAYVQANPGRTVTLRVVRDGQELEATTTLANRNANPVGPAVGFLGVRAEYPRVRESVPGAVVGSFREFGDLSWQSVIGLGRVFSPGGIRDYVANLSGSTEPSAPSGSGTTAGSSSNENRLISPIGAVQLGARAGESGVANFLQFFIAVNIFVGLFNLIPLLPFDGGHIAIASYEAVRSRKGKRYYADIRKMLPVTYAVVAVLLVLFIGNIYLDLARPVGG